MGRGFSEQGLSNWACQRGSCRARSSVAALWEPWKSFFGVLERLGVTKRPAMVRATDYRTSAYSDVGREDEPERQEPIAIGYRADLKSSNGYCRESVGNANRLTWVTGPRPPHWVRTTSLRQRQNSGGLLPKLFLHRHGCQCHPRSAMLSRFCVGYSRFWGLLLHAMLGRKDSMQRQKGLDEPLASLIWHVAKPQINVHPMTDHSIAAMSGRLSFVLGLGYVASASNWKGENAELILLVALGGTSPDTKHCHAW